MIPAKPPAGARESAAQRASASVKLRRNKTDMVEPVVVVVCARRQQYDATFARAIRARLRPNDASRHVIVTRTNKFLACSAAIFRKIRTGHKLSHCGILRGKFFSRAISLLAVMPRAHDSHAPNFNIVRANRFGPPAFSASLGSPHRQGRHMPWTLP